MRVLYAVYNHYWEDANLLAGLRQTGHEVIVHRPPAFYDVLHPDWTSADRTLASERLIEAVRVTHASRPIDVLFSYVMSSAVYPEAIEEVRSMGIPTVNYWCNGSHQFHLVEEISPAFDWCVATERQSLPRYEGVGARPIYAQLAANPDVYRPYEVPLDYDVTFVGRRYSDRPEYIDYLLREDIDVRVWGPGWTRDRSHGERSLGLGITPRYAVAHPRASLLKIANLTQGAARSLRALPPPARLRLRRASGPSLEPEELVRMYSRSRISLGFSTTGDARYTDENKTRQLHLRDFEATMSGALYFLEYQEELEEFYDLGREMVSYRSREELLERIRWFLAHPDEAQRVRRAGYERAQRDHTWQKRFPPMFGAMGLG
jgi:spore maturation protein CgeB